MSKEAKALADATAKAEKTRQALMLAVNRASSMVQDESEENEEGVGIDLNGPITPQAIAGMLNQSNEKIVAFFEDAYPDLKMIPMNAKLGFVEGLKKKLIEGQGEGGNGQASGNL